VDYRFDLSRKGKWDLGLGHTSADFTRLTGDLSGEGVSTRTYGKRLETTFFAGRSDAESSSDDETTEEYDKYSSAALQMKNGLAFIPTTGFSNQLPSGLIITGIMIMWMITLQI
jgi:hypothetical protein